MDTKNQLADIFTKPLPKETFFTIRRELGLLDVKLMQSYPTRALDRRLQEDWAKDAREGPRVLLSLRVDFGPTD